MEYKFKVGDRVTVTPEWRWRCPLECTIVALTESEGERGRLPCYKLDKTKDIFWEGFLILIRPPLSKEEQLNKKIKQLWERQDYFKKHVDKQIQV